jgi:hypothetical protein
MNERIWASHSTDNVGEYDPLHAIEKTVSDRTTLHCTNEGRSSMAHIQLSNEQSDKVNFQLINPHPSTFLTLENSSGNHVIQAYEAVYGKTLDHKRSAGDGYFIHPAISVDLTQMFEPPLLSNWVPGEGFKNDCDGTVSEQGLDFELSRVHDTAHGNSLRNLQLCDVKKNVHELLRCDGSTGQHESTILLNDDNVKNSLIRLSVQDWIEILPSNHFLNVLNERNMQSILRLLRNLFTFCSTRDLGIYVLTVLIPVLFQYMDINSLDHYSGEQMNDLAVLLIDRCNLGGLRKDQLFGLLKSIPASGLAAELEIAVTQEYYKYKR